MKKRILSLLLALSLLSVPALAAENSTEHFTRSKTYSGQFSDLPENHTFYENVAALYEYACLWDRLTALTVSPGT